MGKVNSLIAARLKSQEPSTKMEQMAKKSAAGGLTSFNGLFQVSELSQAEKQTLEDILKTYAKHSDALSNDLKVLSSLTSEIKAINHQAALLHGERLKKAHALLTNYKEGAFSAWLIATYGNRQTPYNLMQYYDFYQSLPHPLREKAEEMPRQALYTLASRSGDLKEKIEFVTCYKGETKAELLLRIRDLFPLEDSDKRKENRGEMAIKGLEKIHSLLIKKSTRLSKLHKESLKELLTQIHSVLKEK